MKGVCGMLKGGSAENVVVLMLETVFNFTQRTTHGRRKCKFSSGREIPDEDPTDQLATSLATDSNTPVPKTMGDAERMIIWRVTMYSAHLACDLMPSLWILKVITNT